LASTPWPFKGTAVLRYAEAVARGDIYATLRAAPPSFGWGLEGLPGWLQRCLRPPVGSEGCWHWEAASLIGMCAFCCDPRHGPGGYPPCFDTLFTFSRCCDRAPQLIVDVVVGPGASAAPSPANPDASQEAQGNGLFGRTPLELEEVQATRETLRRDLNRGCARGRGCPALKGARARLQDPRPRPRARARRRRGHAPAQPSFRSWI